MPVMVTNEDGEPLGFDYPEYDSEPDIDDDYGYDYGDDYEEEDDE